MPGSGGASHRRMPDSAPGARTRTPRTIAAQRRTGGRRRPSRRAPCGAPREASRLPCPCLNSRLAPVVPDLPPMELGYARTPLRSKLVDAVLRGDKTATAGLHGDEPLPEPGQRFLLLDFDDRPVAVVETTEVKMVRVDEVDLEFARDEGEGFQSVAEWREAHERFWADREI